MDQRVLAHVVDDDATFSAAIATLLDAEGIAVVTYHSAEAFLERYEPSDASECLVLDVCMPGLSGLELHERLRARNIMVPVIFLTGLGTVPDAVVAIKHGAFDFLEKPFSNDLLIDRVRAALREDLHRRQALADDAAIAARITRLTKREHEVAMGVAAGLPNKVIAAQLGISPRTVEVYRAKAMSKTGARSVAELVQLMMRPQGGVLPNRASS